MLSATGAFLMIGLGLLLAAGRGLISRERFVQLTGGAGCALAIILGVQAAAGGGHG